MKILGLLLVLGIGIFLIWFFEEIFKGSSEDDYEVYEYEQPRRLAGSGARAVHAGNHTDRAGAHTVHTQAGARTTRAANAGSNTVRAAHLSGREDRTMARIPSGRDEHMTARIPSGADRRARNVQSYRKTA